MDNQGFQLDHRPTKKKIMSFFPFVCQVVGSWCTPKGKTLKPFSALCCSCQLLLHLCPSCWQKWHNAPSPLFASHISAFVPPLWPEQWGLRNQIVCGCLRLGACLGSCWTILLSQFFLLHSPLLLDLCLACSEKTVLFLYPSSVVFETTVNTDTIRCGVHITSFSPTSALSLDRVWTQHFSNSQRKKCQRCYCVAV